MGMKMKRSGRFSSAMARLAEGFLAGLVVLAVANIGYPVPDRAEAAPRTGSFMTLATGR